MDHSISSDWGLALWEPFNLCVVSALEESFHRLSSKTTMEGEMGQQKKLTWFVPVTPAGSPLPHLAATKEEAAWQKLLSEASHMPYKDKSALVHRGYTMDKYPYDPR